jgi:predicted glycoside hydrolase/deacetylase ChbG (UPF0249 family)
MFIEKLGFEPIDKVVILHIDDVGFSHASNVATFECLDFGIASCGSAIVPAPWFLETASICRKNPSYDIGVHVTLTSEYDLYRWRALSSVDPKTGLLDSERSLWRTSEEAIGRITTQAAEVEMRTQVQMAIDNGIDVTHIDTHMGTVMAPKFLPSYLKVAQEFNVPAFLPRVSRDEIEARGLGALADFYLKLLDNLEKKGTPLIDNIITETMGDSPDKTEYYCKMLKELKPGITHFLFHPAKMSPELNAIVPETAKWRDLDYQAFTDPKLKECVKELDLKIIGYREIRDVLRGN